MSHDEILSYFSRYIMNELGIVFAEHNSFQLQSRLEEIAKLTGLPTLEALYEHAKGGISGQFKQLLLDVATNNETSFFRDPKIFRAIEETTLKLFPPLLKPNEPLRIWSAASSTGQEAVSLAITITEFAKKTGREIPFTILGTDVSERVLERAMSGTYSQLEAQRGLSAPLLVKYFSKSADDRWTFSAELRKSISFRKLNLKDPLVFAQQFHLVLCRNVLIYQNVEGKADIIKRLTPNLMVGGHLILGAGESLLGLTNAYEQTRSEGAILYTRKNLAAEAA